MIYLIRIFLKIDLKKLLHRDDIEAERREYHIVNLLVLISDGYRALPVSIIMSASL